MKKNKRYKSIHWNGIVTLTIFMVCACNMLRAQWETIPLDEFSQAILDVEKRIPEGQSYCFDMDHFFFEYTNSTDTAQHLHSSLIYQAKSNTLNFWQLGNFVVQTSDIQITCDTSYRTIILNYPNKEYNRRKGVEDYSKLLKSKCSAKKKINGKYQVYHLEFAPNATYKSAELWIERDGMVKKYILSTGKEWLDDSGEMEKMIQPRMEIVYSNYVFGAAAEKRKTKGSEHFFQDLSTKTLQSQYKGYEVIDLRNN
jgi:hypothetical protein